jgi:uncharacterized protein (TIGR02271 family)
MAFENIVALFGKRADADKAVKALVTAGVAANEISMFDSQRLTAEGKASHTTLKDHGLWRRLFGATVQEHEALIYKDTVENGGVVVSARVEGLKAEPMLAVLEKYHPLDLTERTELLLADARAKGHDEVVRLVEEQLEVGKRAVVNGTTRVRRFVVERPVEAQVTLHEEHAEVLRRAVAEPSFLASVDWSEKTIEVEETVEEAVVNKRARVSEEVVIRKTGSDRVDTVRDTVRKQEIEVERVATSEADRSKKNLA